MSSFQMDCVIDHCRLVVSESSSQHYCSAWKIKARLPNSFCAYNESGQACFVSKNRNPIDNKIDIMNVEIQAQKTEAICYLLSMDNCTQPKGRFSIKLDFKTAFHQHNSNCTINSITSFTINEQHWISYPNHYNARTEKFDLTLHLLVSEGKYTLRNGDLPDNRLKIRKTILDHYKIEPYKKKARK